MEQQQQKQIEIKMTHDRFSQTESSLDNHSALLQSINLSMRNENSLQSSTDGSICNKYGKRKENHTTKHKPKKNNTIKAIQKKSVTTEWKVEKVKVKSENKKRKVFEDTDTKLPNEEKRNNVSLIDEIQQVNMSMGDKGRNASILNEPAQEIPENSNSDLMIEIPEVNSTVTQLPQKKKKILITEDQYAQGFLA
ncbi:hypothetical protein JTB14_026442 [Gonioctena quinquepunctata]|nr:hypothetical protein JTB14_026442 [Gonioctena quinquepunctata]